MPIIVTVTAELPYTSVTVEYDESQLANLVRVGRVDGIVQETTDATSRDDYLTHTFERTDLVMSADGAAADLAGFILHLGKDPELRFAALEINPRRADALWPQVLGRRIGDRIQVIRRPPGGGDPIVRECFIRGISHDFEPGLNWRTTWTLQSATGFDVDTPFLVLDDPTLGLLDSYALGY